MPEKRLAKTRRSLPEGYQFGDSRLTEWDPRTDKRTWQEAYRDGAKLLLTEDAGLIFLSKQDPNSYNTIEAEEHGDEWAV